MYLSLAIPQTKKWSGHVYLVPLDPGKAEIKVTLELPASSTVKKLKQAVGDLTGYDAKKVCNSPNAFLNLLTQQLSTILAFRY